MWLCSLSGKISLPFSMWITLPLVGESTPASILTSVDLPEPFAPEIPIIPHSSTLKVKSLKISLLPNVLFKINCL